MKITKLNLACGLLVGLLLAACAETEPDVQVSDQPNDLSTAAASTWETVLSGSSFSSKSAFEQDWNYYYPWGRDHNGTARMYGYPDHVKFNNGVLTLRAARINWNEGNSSADPHLPIHYHSGAVHAKHQVRINDQYPNYEIKGEFQAPTQTGTWPAFWLTGAWTWPPESDILEYKGNSENWFNTFRTSSDVSTTKVNVYSPGSWHEYRVWITKVSSSNVDIHYYIDGQWKAKHTANFVGKPMWIIINLQMEGSSGSTTQSIAHFNARNIYVGRTKAY